MEDILRSIPAGIMGTKDSGERVIKSIYKVKRADNTNVYDRIHFETQSKMICDASYLATGNMVARRDGNGNIQFRNIQANGTLDVNGATSLLTTLSVGGNTTIGGTATIAGTTTLNGVLEAKQNVNIAKILSVAGTSTLTGAVTARSTINASGTITTGGSFVLPDCTIAKSGSKINLTIGGTAVDGFNFNKNIGVTGSATISSGVTAGGHIQGNSTITANGKITTKVSYLLPGMEIKKDPNAAIVQFNSTADSNGANFNKALSADGATTLRSTLSVSGVSNLTGNVSAKNDLEVLKNLRVVGNTNMSGTLTTSGLMTTNTGLQIPGCKIDKVGNSTSFSSTLTDFYFNKPLRFDANSAVNPNLNADKVDGCDVSNSTTTDTNLWTAKKVDDTKANKSIRVNAGEGLVGGGAISGNVTISHYVPSAVASSFNLRATEVIKSVNFDKYGHAAKITTMDMDKVFATPEQVADLIANAGATSKSQYIAHTILNADGSVSGPARNNVNNVNMKNYSIDYNASSQCIQFSFV